MLRGYTADRSLLALAQESATVDAAAALFGTSVKAIRKKALVLGIPIKDGRLAKQHSARPVVGPEEG